MSWPAAALALAFAIPNPDPRSLAPSAADRERADTFVKLLASEKFKERDAAHRGLYGMGRLALPAIDAALAVSADAETRAKCESLRPKLAAAAFRDHLACFLADTDGKFAHDLPAWNEFKAAVGDSAGSRGLFADMMKVPANVALLAAAATKSPTLSDKLLARRLEIYNRTYNINNVPDRKPLTVPELSVLILAETISGTTPDRRYYFAPFNAIQQPAMREALIALGERPAAFRKLVVHWLDTRTDPLELNYAMTAANALALPELSAAKFAEKVLAAPTAAVYTKMLAATYLARTGDAKYLPLLEKQFDDKTVMNMMRNNVRTEIGARDTALAMAILLTKGDPKAYGFESQNANGAAQFNYYNYSFPTPEARKAAFVKWGFSKIGKK